MGSFKSSINIQKKEGGPDRSVSDNQSSSVTLNINWQKKKKNTEILFFRFYHGAIPPYDANGIANRSSLIWNCTVCPNLFVRKFSIITIMCYNVGIWSKLKDNFCQLP